MATKTYNNWPEIQLEHRPRKKQTDWESILGGAVIFAAITILPILIFIIGG